MLNATFTNFYTLNKQQKSLSYRLSSFLVLLAAAPVDVEPPYVRTRAYTLTYDDKTYAMSGLRSKQSLSTLNHADLLFSRQRIPSPLVGAKLLLWCSALRRGEREELAC